MTARPTPRELQVLDAVIRLGGTKAAAHEVGIAYNTGRTHLDNLQNRLGVDTTVQCVAWCDDWLPGWRART